MIKNQNGSIQLLLIFILLIISGYGLLFILRHRYINQKIRNLTQQTLCSKKFIGESKNFIKKILKANKIINLAKASKIISGLFPILGSVKVSSKVAIQILKRYQDLKYINYQRLSLKTIKRCRASLSILKSPFSIGLKGFKRKNEIVQLREKYSFKFKSTDYLLKVFFNKNNKKYYQQKLSRYELSWSI